MTRIAHISDVHFGRHIPSVVQGLIEDVRREKPDLVILSGDFTQRAHTWQYLQARKFIEGLPEPRLLIPGNHDVPLYNIASRFLTPKHNYRKFLTPETEMDFVSDDVGIVALDSARGLALANGWLDRRQIEKACEKLEEWGPNRVRIVVTHHPFSAPHQFKQRMLIMFAHETLRAFADAGADVFLAGHLHLSYTGSTRQRYPEIKRSMVVASCGTSTSNRGRGEPNNYNLLEIERKPVDAAVPSGATDREAEPEMALQVKLIRKWWNERGRTFEVAAEQLFAKRGVNWSEIRHAPDVLVQPTPHEEKPATPQTAHKTQQ